MKKIITTFLIFILTGMNIFAIEADDSIDETIKREYNTSDLPALPKFSPKSVEPNNIFHKTSNPTTNSTPTVQNEIKNATTNQPKPTQNIQNLPTIPQKRNVRTSKVRYGQRFQVKLNSYVSDGTPKGTQVSFATQAPVITNMITLPIGTKIYGTVVNSHRPQILGNGGLLSIKIDNIVYDGKTSYCEGNITKLNHKLVLYNNIKGDNGYLKGISKITRPGRTFYGKSVRVSKKLWNGPGAILAPITYLPGAVFLVLNSATSPLIAIFSKGDKVSIQKGTTATIKLTSPAYIEY